MDEAAPPERIRRALELAYRIEGVVRATIWPVSGGFVVALRARPGIALAELVRRVADVLAPIQAPGEHWEVTLEDGSA